MGSPLEGKEDQVKGFIGDLTVDDQKNDKVKGIYQNWAQSYEQNLNQIQYRGPAGAAQLLSEVYPAAEDRRAVRVLDVAAGTGFVCEELLKRGFVNIDAVDYSQEMLDIAAEKNIYQQLMCDAFPDTKIPDNSYDALVAVGCFISGHMREDSFQEFRRIIKPGGKMVFTIRVSALREKPVYRDHFEQTIAADVERGVWRTLVRRVDPNYVLDDESVVFALQNTK